MRGLLGRRRLIKDLKTQPALWADNCCQRRKTDFLRAISARSSFKNAENNKPPAMAGQATTWETLIKSISQKKVAINCSHLVILSLD